MAKKEYLILPFIFILLCISCSRGSHGLKDGYYTAQAEQFDSNGWKEYLTIRVSGGKIIHVEYNAFNASGFIKSWDMDYMRDMAAAAGTYPSAYTRIYEESFLTSQSTDEINCISGATHSYKTFLVLAETVLENALIGSHEISFVDVPDYALLDNSSIP